MADALASGASVRKDVGVQVPPRAPLNIELSNHLASSSIESDVSWLSELLQRKSWIYEGVNRYRIIR